MYLKATLHCKSVDDYYVFAISILIKHIRLNERLCDGDFTDLKSLNKKLGDQRRIYGRV